MKKLLLLFVLGVMSLGSFAQYESLLADTTRQWNIYNSNSWHFVEEKIESYFIGGSITYNANDYTEIYQNTHGNRYRMGYLREDTVAGKLWFLKDTIGQTDNLIYDLSVQVGDTFNYNFIVDTIYYKQSKKHIKLRFFTFFNYKIEFPTHYISSNYDSLLFIEGVGTSRGFEIQPFPTFNYFYSSASDYLICAFKNSTAIYHPTLPSALSPIISCDSVTPGMYTSIEAEVGVLDKLFISPNPTKGVVNIPYVEGLERAEVYDVRGTSVFRYTQKRASSVSDEASQYNVANATLLDDQSKKYRDAFLVDLSNQPNGIYFLKLIMQNGEVFTKKVIKE